MGTKSKSRLPQSSKQGAEFSLLAARQNVHEAYIALANFGNEMQELTLQLQRVRDSVVLLNENREAVKETFKRDVRKLRAEAKKRTKHMGELQEALARVTPPKVRKYKETKPQKQETMI